MLHAVCHQDLRHLALRVVHHLESELWGALQALLEDVATDVMVVEAVAFPISLKGTLGDAISRLQIRAQYKQLCSPLGQHNNQPPEAVHKPQRIKTILTNSTGTSWDIKEMDSKVHYIHVEDKVLDYVDSPDLLGPRRCRVLRIFLQRLVDTKDTMEYTNTNQAKYLRVTCFKDIAVIVDKPLVSLKL